jgi:hypothetical protein
MFSTFTVEAGLTPNTDILRMPTLSSQILLSLFTQFFLSKFFFQFILNLINLFQSYPTTPARNLSPWISLNSLHMKSVPPSNLTHLPHLRSGFWTVPLRLFEPPAVSMVTLNDPQPR